MESSVQLSSYVAAIVILVGGIMTVTLRSIFRAALALGLALLGVAGLFVTLGADFLGFVQLLVYVGAVLTLVVFAVMLTTGLGDPSLQQSNTQRVPAGILTTGLFGVLAVAIVRTPQGARLDTGHVSVAALGEALLTRYVLPFEVMAFVFLACLIGAVAVARVWSQGRPPDAA